MDGSNLHTLVDLLVDVNDDPGSILHWDLPA